MIASSRAMQGTAIVMALGLHIAAFYSLDWQDDVQIAGAGAPQEVSLGNAFADMVSGVMTSQITEEVTDPVTPSQTAPIETIDQAVEPPREDAQQREVPTNTTNPVTPTHAQPIAPDPSQQSPDTAETTSQTQPQAAQAVAPVLTLSDPDNIVVAESTLPEATAIEVTQAPTVIARTTTATALRPTQPTKTTTVAPAAAATVTAIPEVETLAGEDASVTAPLRSVRPPVRPEGLAPPPPPRQTQTARQAQPAPQQPRGNAQQNANQGAQTAAPRENAAASSGSDTNTSQTTVASNAAISNYPGQVLRRVSRVRKPRTNVRGSAFVTFTISSGGGLAGVSVSRSSGSSDLDNAAIQVIQRAAPFPAPPAGAQTRFTVEITGR